jgi:HEPN domain-containing protein
MSASQHRPWLDIATEDLIVARQVLREDHPAHACFLSQQCIEKSLKGFLVSRVRSYPRIHNLVDLLNQCAQVEGTFAQYLDDCTRVDEYYIPTRYPAGLPGAKATGMPGKDDAQIAIDAAARILKFVEQQLNS